MDLFLFVLEMVGTVAFAVSGAMTAMKKNMDIFGVCILGLTTAVGGGIIRDLVLGITPPQTFVNPSYAITAVVVSLLVFLPGVRRFLKGKETLYDRVLFVMDALGLGIFTVAGVQTACLRSEEYGLFLLLFVGVVTGVGGGLLRDVMAQNTPYIFTKHIYACASILGAVVCALLWKALGATWAMVLGMVCAVTLRCLSYRFKWSLPRANLEAEQQEKEKENG